MSQLEQDYLRAREAWVVARRNYKRALNALALEQLKVGDMGPAGGRGLQWHFDYAFRLYEPVAARYLRALKAYTHERPELTGRLLQDYMEEAVVAQWNSRAGVADGYLKSVEALALESVKTAHADWVRNGNKQTFAAVMVALVDAQLMNADHYQEVQAIAEEIQELALQGKFRRDPAAMPVRTPKVPPVRHRQPGPSLWLHRTLPR